MALYGSFKYGTGVLYGSTAEPRLRWAIEVDWDGDGLFTGENEATNCIEYSCRRGRDFFLNSSGNGFEPVRVGELRIVLLNVDGRYDPYNISSPLYDYLNGNQIIRVRVYDAQTDTWYNRFYGYISDIRPNYGDLPTVRLTAVDPLDKLGVEIRSTIYSSIRYDDAIEQCLIDAGWTGATNIDSTVSDTMPFWWADGVALHEIQDLTNAVNGRFFASADGTMTYKSRISSDSPVVDIGDDDYLQSYRVRVPSPRDVVRNVVRIYARARQEQTAVEIWRAVDIPSIPAEETKTVWASFSYLGIPAPATSVTTPVATTDYTANTQSDGGGSDITADISIVMTVFAKTAKLEITNNNVTDTAYMTLLKLRGDVITADDYTFAEESDVTSIDRYGIRNLTIQTDWLQDYNQALDQAGVLAQLLANPRQFPRILIRNMPAAQFTPDLFDIANLDFASIGFTDQLRVSYLDETWVTPNGAVVDTIMQFEPSLTGYTSGTWIFPATFGLTTIFA